MSCIIHRGIESWLLDHSVEVALLGIPTFSIAGSLVESVGGHKQSESAKNIRTIGDMIQSIAISIIPTLFALGCGVGFPVVGLSLVCSLSLANRVINIYAEKNGLSNLKRKTDISGEVLSISLKVASLLILSFYLLAVLFFEGPHGTPFFGRYDLASRIAMAFLFSYSIGYVVYNLISKFIHASHYALHDPASKK